MCVCTCVRSQWRLEGDNYKYRATDQLAHIRHWLQHISTHLLLYGCTRNFHNARYAQTPCISGRSLCEHAAILTNQWCALFSLNICPDSVYRNLIDLTTWNCVRVLLCCSCRFRLAFLRCRSEPGAHTRVSCLREPTMCFIRPPPSPSPLLIGCYTRQAFLFRARM